MSDAEDKLKQVNETTQFNSMVEQSPIIKKILDNQKKLSEDMKEDRESNKASFIEMDSLIKQGNKDTSEALIKLTLEIKDDKIEEQTEVSKDLTKKLVAAELREEKRGNRVKWYIISFIGSVALIFISYKVNVFMAL